MYLNWHKSNPQKCQRKPLYWNETKHKLNTKPTRKWREKTRIHSHCYQKYFYGLSLLKNAQTQIRLVHFFSFSWGFWLIFDAFDHFCCCLCFHLIQCEESILMMPQPSLFVYSQQIFESIFALFKYPLSNTNRFWCDFDKF